MAQNIILWYYNTKIVSYYHFMEIIMVAYLNKLTFIFISTTFKQIPLKYIHWYTNSQEKILTDLATGV